LRIRDRLHFIEAHELIERGGVLDVEVVAGAVEVVELFHVDAGRGLHRQHIVVRVLEVVDRRVQTIGQHCLAGRAIAGRTQRGDQPGHGGEHRLLLAEPSRSRQLSRLLGLKKH